MKTEEILKHPDVFHLLTITHAGVAKIVKDLSMGDTHLIAVDSSHGKYSKIYVLDKEDVLNTEA